MKKRYLNVAYEDRNLAKRLGAQWDPSVRRWYCVPDSPLSKIFEWRKESKMSSMPLDTKKNTEKDTIISCRKKVCKHSNLKSASFTKPHEYLHERPENLELFA